MNKAMVQERDIRISLPDGETDAGLFEPAGGISAPGILYLTDIGGIRPAQRQAARRLASEGYVVLMPNVFYRVASPPVMDMAALRPQPELFMKRIGELAQGLTPEAVERDAHGYIEYLSSLPSVSNKNNLGVVGFCFCGAYAMRVAAAYPEQVVACASFHGGGLFKKDDATSPHLLLPRIKAQLLFGHSEQDKSMPEDAIAAFEEALENWGGQYESEIYAGALHGWTTLDNPVYHPEQAARAYDKLTSLFAANLQG